MAVFVCPRCGHRFFRGSGLAILDETQCATCALPLEEARLLPPPRVVALHPPTVRELQHPPDAVPPSSDSAVLRDDTDSLESGSAEWVLATYAEVHGWRVLHPRAIVGMVNGLRVAVEYEGGRDGHLYLDIEVDTVAEGVLPVLQKMLEDATGATARVERLGAIVHAEWACKTLLPDAFEDVVERAVQACVPSHGAYR
jgi:hypothetical protein